MMSLQPVADGRASYYLREVGQGAEEYYTEGGEVPGRWLGTLAGRVGLSGEVDGDDLHSVLAGVIPSTGERIARTNRRVAALDLTLSAPKSVSVLWAFGGDAAAAAVMDAHDRAVDVALGYLEREAVRARRGKAGVEVIDGTGLIAAAFRHRTSRLGDPQLHTHVLVANATYCPDDDQWRALHGKVLYWHARAAGHLYQVELRRGLSAALDLTWTPTVKGCAEIVGIPERVLAEFSRRRAAIEQEMARAGDTSPRGARRAAVATRPPKERDVDYGALRSEWENRADLHGLRINVVEKLLRSQRAPEQTSERSTIEVTDELLAASLTERDSVFDRRHVLMAVANNAHSNASATDVEGRAEEFLASAQAVPVGVAVTGIQYSTAELLEIERHLIERSSERQHEGAAMCRSTIVDRTETLSTEQRRMVEAITTDGAGVSVVIGAAGTGKTHALGAARERWETNGDTVIGCALAARAAAQLEADSGIPSCSLDRLVGALDRERMRLSPDIVVVVDEAAMVGTRKLSRLLDHADHTGAKVVLVGDHHQLPEIEAGGAFAALAQRLGAVTLTENRRQHDPVERAALDELRDGDVARAIDLLTMGGRIHERDTRDAAREEMVADWLEAILDDGRDAIMLAVTRADVADLNQRARAHLVAEGAISEPGVRIGEREFAVGDWVTTTRNDYRLGVLNGQRGVVRDADRPRGSLTVSFDDGGSITLSSSYVENGGVDYAYATTIHKAQGLTCDVALVLGDENLYREAGYTALARGRDANHLYIAARDEDAESHLPEDDAEAALDRVQRALGQSRGQTLASINLLDLPAAPLPDAIKAAREIGYEVEL